MKKVILSAVALFASTQIFAQSVNVPADIAELLQKNTCFACHKADVKLIGPAYTEVAKRKYTPERIVELVYKPNPANWPGYIPMAALPNVPKDDIIKIAKWINSLNAPKGKGKKK